MKSNYLFLIDNLMDLTHLGYVHTGTIGGEPTAHVEAEMEIERTETGAYFLRWMLDHDPAPTFKKAGRFTGRVDRWQEFEYLAPSIVVQWSGALQVGRGARQNRNQDGGFQVRLLHCATPETDTSFHYFWSAATGYRQDDPHTIQEFYDDGFPTIVEDKVIMEAQQERIDLDPARPLLDIHADGALALARISLGKMIEAEQARAAQAPA